MLFLIDPEPFAKTCSESGKTIKRKDAILYSTGVAQI